MCIHFARTLTRLRIIKAKWLLLGCALSLALPVSLSNASAQAVAAYNAVYHFHGTDGTAPASGVIQGKDGNYYGTTQRGGNGASGTIFLLSTDGLLTVLTTLYSFPGLDGLEYDPSALVQTENGDFYGTTYYGGSTNEGSVFNLTAAGVFNTFTTLDSFNLDNGEESSAPLIQARSGNLYGTTRFGGTSNNGVVFSLAPTGALTVIHAFNGSDGSGSLGSLIEADAGVFYGTTYSGGTSDNGTIFRVTAAGSLTTVHSFDGSDGSGPFAALIRASDGNFYGTTSSGTGAAGSGTVYRITAEGELTTLHDFSATDGAFSTAALI